MLFFLGPVFLGPVLLGSVLFASALLGQPAQEGDFSSQVNLVPVPTLVRDAKGDAVSGLVANDFVLEDDGVQQTIHLDDAAASEPISLMVVVQCGSRANREFERMAGLASMLDPVLSDPENEAALLFVDSKLDLAQDFTHDADKIESRLKNIPQGDGGAAIVDAIAYSARLLGRRDQGRQRVLLLISETRDHGSKFTKLDDAVSVVDANNVTVYALPFSPYVSQQLDVLRGTNRDEWTPGMDLLQKIEDVRQAMRKNIPRTLADLTGGEYESFATKSNFEDHLIVFANHLHARYALSFEPKDPHAGLHQIRVRLRTASDYSSILYRRTYWVGEGARK